MVCNNATSKCTSFLSSAYFKGFWQHMFCRCYVTIVQLFIVHRVQVGIRSFPSILISVHTLLQPVRAQGHDSSLEGQRSSFCLHCSCFFWLIFGHDCNINRGNRPFLQCKATKHWLLFPVFHQVFNWCKTAFFLPVLVCKVLAVVVAADTAAFYLQLSCLHLLTRLKLTSSAAFPTGQKLRHVVLSSQAVFRF